MMLEAPRKLFHELHTRRKNQQNIAALEAHLRTQDPALLVHQMGRAGSMTTVNTLRSAGLAMPVIHTHWLNPASIQKRLGWVSDLPEHRHPLNVRASVRIAEEIQRHGPKHRHWHLVTVFREPVARNLSVFFLSIEAFIDDFFKRHAAGELPNDRILEIFLDRFPHDQPVRWFDEEVRDVFGLDVYRHPFPQDRGFQVLHEDGISMLLIKVERLNDCYQQAFEAFLGLNIPRLEQTHITERDPSYTMYGDFISTVSLPKEYLDRMYDTTFARHFYSPGEIDAFRRRWGGRLAMG